MSAIYQCETWKHSWWEGLPDGFWAKVNGKDWHGEQGKHIPDSAKYKVTLYFGSARVAQAEFDVGSKTKICLFVGRIREAHDGFEPGTYVIARGTPPNCADVKDMRELWRPHPNWMADVYEKQSATMLKNIALPGTHDSATDEMTPSSPYASGTPALAYLENIISKIKVPIVFNVHDRIYDISKAQTHPVYIQLMNGVRYLDIRALYFDGWKTEHGLVSNQLKDVIDQIGRFSSEHPKEALIVHFQSVNHFNKDQTQDLIDYLCDHKTFGRQLASSDDFDEGVTLKQLWDKGKSIVCLFKTEESVKLKDLWPDKGNIDNPWPETRHSEKVKDYLIERLPKRPSKGFYVSQAVVTPDAAVVLNLTKTLLKIAKEWMNPELPSLVETLDKKARENKKSLNIVIADCYQSNGSFISTMIDINRQNLLKAGAVQIQNDDGHFLGFKRANDPEIWGSASRVGSYEKLELVDNGDGTYALKNQDGNYLGFKADNTPQIWGSALRVGGYEAFEIVTNGDGSHALMNKDGNYLGFKKSNDPNLWGTATRVGSYEKLTITELD